MHKWGGQDEGAVVGSGVLLSPPMQQECLKMQQFSQKTRWILAGWPVFQRGITGATQNSVEQRREGTRMKGKKEERRWDQPAPGAEGADVQGRAPPSMAVHWNGGVTWSCWEWANQPVTVWTEWEPHRQARLQAFIPRTGLWVHWCPRKLGAGAMGTEEWSQGEDSCWPWGINRMGWDGGNLLHWMLLKEAARP